MYWCGVWFCIYSIPFVSCWHALEGGEIEFQQWNSYLSWKKQTLRLTRKDARLRYMEWSNLTFDPWRTQAESAFKHWTQFPPLPIWVPYNALQVLRTTSNFTWLSVAESVKATTWWMMFYVSNPPKAPSSGVHMPNVQGCHSTSHMANFMQLPDFTRKHIENP